MDKKTLAEHAKEHVKESKEFVHVSEVATLMSQSFKDGINTCAEVIKDVCVKCEEKKNSEEFMKGILTAAKAVLQAQEQAEVQELVNEMTTDLIDRAAKADLAKFRMPFYKKKKGKVRT